MPVQTPVNAIKLTFGGSIAEEADIWSFGLHLTNLTGTDVTAGYDALDIDAIYQAFATNMNDSATTGLYVGNTFEYARAQLVDDAGKPIGVAKYSAATTPEVGIDTTQYIPQNSLVVSLLTDLRVGRAAKGRFYLPSGYGHPAPNGKINAGELIQVVQMVQSFLDDVNGAAAAASPFLALSTFSPKSTVFGSEAPAASNTVLNVAIGDVVDTQRRRRNSINENYINGPLA